MTDMAATQGGAAVGTRIFSLDVVRGFAVMGILTMNIIAFAMPQGAYISPLAWGEASPANIAEWAINFLLFDGKMRGLFSMMFGASMLLIIDAAEAGGRSAARTHYGRMVTLALFGLLHYYLIWMGDILFLYAMCGMLLFFFAHQSIKTFWSVGIALIGGQMLLYGVLLTVLHVLAARNLPGTVDAYNDMLAPLGPNAAENIREVARMLGSYGEIAGHRMTTGDAFIPLASVPSFGMETIGLMLIGMALFRSGMFSGVWDSARLRLWRNRCLGIGLAGNAALLGWQFASGLDAWVVMTSSLAWSVPFDVMMAIGWGALFVDVAQRFAGGALIGRVAAAGRAAFTNYLGTSIVMTTIFYGYGLGLYGSVPRWALWAFVIGAWAAMLLWSKPWLDRYRYGPLEWLWRTLARLELQPLRK
ncbi:MAG: DUF418 domain-containing protein [Sphingopyxis sp.]|nr:DUF418 domain-containing protein [Sphingopyxis sp.]